MRPLPREDDDLLERARITPGAAVLGTGSVLGSRVVTNEALKELVRNYDEASGDFATWVERVTHIQTRPWFTDGESVGSTGTLAAKRALEAARVDPGDVDLVILCSFTEVDLYPGDRVDIARALNSRCGTVVLSAGCAGSVYGVSVAAGMVKSDLCRHVVVVAAEQLIGTVDFNDPLTAILFGDGAASVVVGKPRHPGQGFVDRVVLKHQYSPANITMKNANLAVGARVLGPDKRAKEGQAVERQFLRMGGGPRVLRNAIQAMAETTVELLGYTVEDLKEEDPSLRKDLDRVFLVPHQANGRIVDGLQEKLGLDPDRVYRTIYHSGNMSCVTNLYTLDYAIRTGNLRREEQPDGRGKVSPCGRRLRRGDTVILTTVGAGYIYGAVGFTL